MDDLLKILEAVCSSANELREHVDHAKDVLSTIVQDTMGGEVDLNEDGEPTELYKELEDMNKQGEAASAQKEAAEAEFNSKPEVPDIEPKLDFIDKDLELAKKTSEILKSELPSDDPLLEEVHKLDKDFKEQTTKCEDLKEQATKITRDISKAQSSEASGENPSKD